MKHVLTSAGLVALGVTALQAFDPQMTRQQTGRPFTVAATVRGFYDDNVNLSPKRTVRNYPFPGEEESLGVEVSPSIHLNLPMEQTFISLGYTYSLKWYEERSPRNYDQSHEFNGKLRHQFGPKHDIGIDDSFVVSSEPTVVDRGGIITTPIRSRSRSGVMHNRGAIEDNIWLTQQIGLSFGYVNNWYDYEQENVRATGARSFPYPFDPRDVVGSRSALLDRIEHLFRADARYQVNPKLVALVGYMFGLNTYTGDDVIANTRTVAPGVTVPLVPPLMSDDRDNTTHYIYGGADFDLTAQLRASVRLGGQFTDYDEGGSSANPYADASLAYVYLPGSSVDVGIRHHRHATDIVTPDSGGTPTLDGESTVVYAQVTHKITHALTGSLIGQYQTTEFNDGFNDGRGEDLFLVGVNLEYRINRHLSTEVGYNWDRLLADVGGRSYVRNRVYIGLRASY